MKIRIIDFIALFLIMLVSGVFWGTWFTLTRSIEKFPAGEFIHIGKVIIANVADPMKVIMPSCIIFIIVSAWFHDDKRSSGFYLTLGAFALMGATLLITLAVLVPIDNEINRWTVDTVPSNWEEIRSRWKIFHFMRTLTSLTSFAFFSFQFVVLKVPLKEIQH
jgi:uncharacterized membrane protein